MVSLMQKVHKTKLIFYSPTYMYVLDRRWVDSGRLLVEKNLPLLGIEVGTFELSGAFYDFYVIALTIMKNQSSHYVCHG